MPVSCETSFSETIRPENYSSGVREGSVEDGAAKRRRDGVGVLMRDAHVTSEPCTRDLYGGFGDGDLVETSPFVSV